ncbi:MAG: SUMF1/EgtB/PvdO family nonheme iron enzyme, partial [Burkholderiaceae bacterium]|nr:SUMF1/EgtB/PvdO family nonheme iron enzyme [Burkholderiaceae bacterium]
MIQFAQQSRPARGSIAVAITRARAGRGNNRYSHEQVITIDSGYARTITKSAAMTPNTGSYSNPVVQMLQAARLRTLALVGDLGGDRLLGPRLKIVNPPLWEIGHLGWFQEYWCLRGGGITPAMRADADALYNSATVPHAARWDLPLPDIDATLAYLKQVLERVIERVDRQGATDRLRYFAQLAAFHEEMHCEAFTYTRQTLGYPPPGPALRTATRASGALPGDVEIPGGRFMLGAAPDTGFVFDNEKWAHGVEVPPYRMARAPVTCAEFAQFVDDSGYLRREWWSAAGWHWREEAGALAPVYWHKAGGQWLQRHYDAAIACPP